MITIREKLLLICLPFVQFFFLGCLMGWIWEAILYFVSHRAQESLISVLINLRGFLHGPWVPIYGAGCVLMLMLRKVFPQKPVLFLIACTIVSGLVEYFTSWFLELIFYARWWDYSTQFLNLNGRICLSSLLFFGFAGTAAVYLLEPAFQGWMQRVSLQNRKILCMVLCILFMLDAAVSLASPNLGMGVLILK